MKLIIVFLALAFAARTSFAETRGILVEMAPHYTTNDQGEEQDTPTVNIYSDVPSEQRINAAIADAAAVLKQVRMPLSVVYVYVLSFDTDGTQDLLSLLDGLKGNAGAKLQYVELCFPPRMSDRAKHLQQDYKVPGYIKAVQPQSDAPSTSPEPNTALQPTASGGG